MGDVDKGATGSSGPRLVAKVSTAKGALREAKAEGLFKINVSVKVDKPKG